MQSPDHVSNANNEDNLLPPIPLDLNRTWARPRVSSVSSESSDSSTTSMTSTTSTSSTSSVTMSSSGVLHLRSERTMKVLQRHHPYYHPSRHRVVLSDRYDDADIMLIMPADPKTMVGKRRQMYDQLKTRGADLTQSQFLFGPTAKLFRQQHVRDDFPAKVHPYRIIPRHPTPTPRASTSVPPENQVVRCPAPERKS